ncbi:sodium:alanine symporter family protein [Neisseria leonii]|uniref:alanine/glycine:cation symporter family protein n=1 Tax=Neisseria leonii TaxID=2995413 RepID=UPI00237B3EED|nr:alanine/glycine:cation symporter family protein [Neisseria sp. 3986]MDD9326286.1 alanine:cation symporter family protein [Neisseria sp. 3986]
MEQMVNTLVDYIWGNGLVYLALAVGLYFTLATRGVQFRYLPEMIRLLRERQESGAGISPFQAFCMSLSGRIGVGNIAGVATAIAAGGPGAVFWMVVMALLGAAAAFTESTLAQIYKTEVGTEYRGGSPYYIEKGLKLKGFAVLVAVVICLSYGVLVPGIQANTIAASFDQAFGLPSWVTGAAVSLFLAFLIFGGTKRIARAADRIIPLMALGYVCLMLVVLVAHAGRIPETVGLIVGSAFGTDALFGGMVGTAVAWGVRRAVFSNVAGAGEATFSSAAAEVSHPVKQGLVQGFSVYIDTVVVCSATAVMILITGMYNVQSPGMDTPLVANIPGVAAGAAYTQAALGTVFGSFGGIFVAVGIFFFAFTCLMAYYYIAETALLYLDQKLKYPLLGRALRLVFLAVVFAGSVQSAGLMWGLGDIGFGSMCYLNLIAIVLLSRPALRALRDYDRQRKAGIDPVFDPRAAGIDGADFWVEYARRHRR